MKLAYQVNYKPKDWQGWGKVILFALQQLLAILAATIAVPAITNGNTLKYFLENGTGAVSDMSTSAALFGAGVGTLVYLLFTKFRSPVFLGSSFAFLGSMAAAFAGALTASVGYFGLIIGAVLAGLVYVILSIVVKFCGADWISKIMPPVVIGPTVAIIGLSLAGNAIGDLNSSMPGLICGLITLFVTIAVSVYSKGKFKIFKTIPFIIGIVAGYLVATIFTVTGLKGDLVDFSKFANMQWYPDFTFVEAFFKGGLDFGSAGFGSYLATIAIAYVPVAFVVFAEHIADHKNLSSIIEKDLLTDPGLDKTLLGDGVGSMVGAFFGGCPNTTYGESIGCVAISGNASVVTILVTSCLAILSSFFAPFVTLLSTIPSCVMGGVCVALYGFIAVSGLKMVQKVDLEDNRNLFVVSTILIAGVGGLVVTFGKITITAVACALILGIIV
ncbi:MAG: uracil-xanthine permease, partial [Clostridia bacterium]|nr:uracil-xanthine permease [Clostridia bacterium]